MKAEESLYKKIWDYKLKDTHHLPKIKYPTGSLRVDEAFKLVKQGKRFLDVGCGTGTLAYLVKENFDEVYGVDIEEAAVKEAKKIGVKASTLNVNEQILPFADGYFDTITCLAVIEHVFEPEVLIAELARVTKRGGMLILDTPNMRYLKYLFSIIINGEFPKTSGDIEHSYDGGHLHYFTFKDIKNLLSKYGFKIDHHAKAHLPESKKKPWYKILSLLGPWFEREFLSIEILVSARKIK
ncbi:MAG: hypothetical protein A2Z42_03440 [Candidatus Woykebacteria bacterium RBG_19FT_COMBO_43_10]|uniref:Methyltransferase type 11 domain-containing protein n=1 Tax=Candidatus Woykebacteria bacterium RBG_19FT_COMBO_43_10 TaxID=1802598 RepID=A0A1G1WFB8_9BACT|nr:MAG: hypothetical protein A2Z42_03440 [Candidatus Woykebacteria bacterium RBG_19FT_COMBO_43_10]